MYDQIDRLFLWNLLTSGTLSFMDVQVFPSLPIHSGGHPYYSIQPSVHGLSQDFVGAQSWVDHKKLGVQYSEVVLNIFNLQPWIRIHFLNKKLNHTFK